MIFDKLTRVYLPPQSKCGRCLITPKGEDFLGAPDTELLHHPPPGSQGSDFCQSLRIPCVFPKISYKGSHIFCFIFFNLFLLRYNGHETLYKFVYNVLI